MKSSSFQTMSLTRSALTALTVLAAAALLHGCGDTADNEPATGQQQDDANNDDNGNPGAENENANGDEPIPVEEGGLPIDPGGGAAGTMPSADTLLELEQCASGWVNDEGVTPGCNATYQGLCFESDAEACACAGCGGDACVVAESFPTQVGCQNDGPLPGCDFIVFDICYESAEAACQAAGCGLEDCAILESYPAQPRCN